MNFANNLFGLLLVTLLFAFTFAPKATSISIPHVAAESDQLCHLYESGWNVLARNPAGKTVINPSATDLTRWQPNWLQQHRVRVTLETQSDNDLCSSELVITDADGRLEGNYTINGCSSYGWIFFTDADCFNVELFHDAGLEAPYGSDVHGSAKWTFQFDQRPKISGTYMDLGAARMFRVAQPCYQRSFRPETTTAALRTNHRAAAKSFSGS